MAVNLLVYGSDPRIILPVDNIGSRMCAHCHGMDLAAAAKRDNVVICELEGREFILHKLCAPLFVEEHSPVAERISPSRRLTAEKRQIMFQELLTPLPVPRDFANFSPTRQIIFGLATSCVPRPGMEIARKIFAEA